MRDSFLGLCGGPEAFAPLVSSGGAEYKGRKGRAAVVGYRFRMMTQTAEIMRKMPMPMAKDIAS